MRKEKRRKKEERKEERKRKEKRKRKERIKKEERKSNNVCLVFSWCVFIEKTSVKHKAALQEKQVEIL